MSTNPPSASPRNRRLSPRRSAKSGTKVECRKGTMGLGPNLAVGLLDVSESGARLLLKVALEPNQEVELVLLAVGQVREVKMPGRIVWCVAAADGRYCVGVQLQKRLGYSCLQDLGRLMNA
jgi:hypothetical protein